MHASMKRVDFPGSGKVHIAHRSRRRSSRFGRLILIASGLLTWTALPLVAHAQGPAFLVKDINSIQSSAPTSLTSFDGKVPADLTDVKRTLLFVADDGHACLRSSQKKSGVCSCSRSAKAMLVRVRA